MSLYASVDYCGNLVVLCRASLREGARVLVDEDDRETYDLVLSGDYVPGKSMTKIIIIEFVIHLYISLLSHRTKAKYVYYYNMVVRQSI